MVRLVAVLDAAQDRQRVLDARLADEDRLEATLERAVLLDVLAMLRQRRRADATQLAAGQRRLQQVARVGRALGLAGPDDRVQLVDEQDDSAVALGDLLDHRLEPLFELAAILRAGEQRAHVESDNGLVLQRLRHVAVDDADGQPFDDGRLADARLADEDGVVLRSPGQHLHGAADLLIAADDRVDLAEPGQRAQVLAILLERLILALGRLIGHPLISTHVLQSRHELVLRHAGLLQQCAGIAILLEQRKQDVLCRNILVLELFRLLMGDAEDLLRLGPDARIAAGAAGQ